jgi:guanine deaminase
MPSHQDFMKRAIELAVRNVESGAGGPFAAVVVRDGQVIGEGANQVTSTNDPSAHAEVMAIRNACRTLNSFQLEGCDIYTTCEPCPMCLGLIYWARPAKVYYAATAQDAAKAGFDDEFIYREMALPVTKRAIPAEQVSLDERLQPFETWAKKPDKVEY